VSGHNPPAADQDLTQLAIFGLAGIFSGAGCSYFEESK
jgi:hypothetical protein